MHAPDLPEPWIIAELERQRRIREWQRDDRPCLELPLPPPPRRGEHEQEPVRTVIVIDLC